MEAGSCSGAALALRCRSVLVSGSQSASSSGTWQCLVGAADWRPPGAWCVRLSLEGGQSVPAHGGDRWEELQSRSDTAALSRQKQEVLWEGSLPWPFQWVPFPSARLSGRRAEGRARRHALCSGHSAFSEIIRCVFLPHLTRSWTLGEFACSSSCSN